MFFRVGGDIAGKATQTLVVNSANVIGDDLWLWRADHSNGVGWTTNPAANGLIVNGANVTMYGLAVEHYEKYQITWNGNGGRTYFYQSEMPYDVPDQGSWTTSGGDLGYASYKVANTVTVHEAWGLGIYAYFRDNPSLVLGHAIEVPTTSGVQFHDMVTTVARRSRHHQPHHRQHGGSGHRQPQRGGPDQLPLVPPGVTGSGPAGQGGAPAGRPLRAGKT